LTSIGADVEAENQVCSLYSCFCAHAILYCLI
jgi:hypothetical protein